MKTEETTYNQTLDEIRQDLSEAELSGMNDDEYIALLSKHTTSLVSFVEQLSSEQYHLESFERVLGILFQDLSEPICVLDEKQTILFYNQGWKTFTQGSCSNKPFGNCFSEKDQKSLGTSLHQAAESGKRTVFTLSKGKNTRIISVLPFKGFDRAIKFLLLAYSEDVVKDIRGTPSGIQKKAALESTAVKDAFLDMIDGFYFIIDTRMQLGFVSDKLEAKLGYTPKEVLSKTIYSILDKASAEPFACLFDSVLSQMEPPSKPLEVVFRNTSKRRRAYELSLRMHPDGEQLLGLCKDIEHHKLTEREMARSKRDAEVNDRMKSAFLANMSHEIRTPLNGIVGFSTMLGQDNIPAEKKEKYLRIVRTSTMHLMALVSDIIDISKIEAGQLQMVYSPVNIHYLLSDLHATFVSEARRLNKTNLNIIKQTPRPNEAFYIRSDEIRLRQVISNLLSNALKFTNEGCITFGYRLDEAGKIRFFVRDTGAGMGKAEQKTVFVRYKQTEEGRKSKYQGTGIGLAISKGIVNLMEGEISLQSEPGAGTEFFFTLPLEVVDNREEILD